LYGDEVGLNYLIHSVGDEKRQNATFYLKKKKKKKKKKKRHDGRKGKKCKNIEYKKK